jgi:AraC-like DNA-binding protein
MIYREYKPGAQLAKYIDAYWTGTTAIDDKPAVQRIMPDTCADIIINLGSMLEANNGGKTYILPGQCYLVGTMTRFCDTLYAPEARLIGIRFKPFALHAMLGISLSGIANKTVELGRGDFAFKKFIASKKITSLPGAFDAFFAEKINNSQQVFMDVLETINQTKGTITVAALSKKHFITERQLERMCEIKAGVTLKELCKQTRFRHAVKMLQQKQNNTSLNDVAFETGFYDHSHLTKEIKKYTGYTPSYYSR